MAETQLPQQPRRVLFFSNNVAEDGFGRIANSLASGLQRRGYQVGAASIGTSHVPWNWPYQVWALAGHDIWAELQSCIAALQPDVVVVCQDWPYLTNTIDLPRIDWSRHAAIGITPTDGTPIYQEWIDHCPRFDALFTISQFGVAAFQAQGGRDRWGQAVGLLRPGVDQAVFYPAVPEERAMLRHQAGISQTAYVLGSWMVNQGRKCWPEALTLFGRFHALYPESVFIADAERVSPAGWTLPVLAKQIARTEQLPSFDEAIRYRDELAARGLAQLRQRMVLADVALQFAYREGFGLPTIELQACRVLTAMQDWCSGAELCGQGRGLLVASSSPGRYGTWGNARDHDPDLDDALHQLLRVQERPAWAAAIVEQAYQAVKQEGWDALADQLDETIKRVLYLRAKQQADYQAAHPLPGQRPLQPAPTPAPVPAGGERSPLFERYGFSAAATASLGVTGDVGRYGLPAAATASSVSPGVLAALAPGESASTDTLALGEGAGAG